MPPSFSKCRVRSYRARARAEPVCPITRSIRRRGDGSTSPRAAASASARCSSGTSIGGNTTGVPSGASFEASTDTLGNSPGCGSHGPNHTSSSLSAEGGLAAGGAEGLAAAVAGFLTHDDSRTSTAAVGGGADVGAGAEGALCAGGGTPRASASFRCFSIHACWALSMGLAARAAGRLTVGCPADEDAISTLRSRAIAADLTAGVDARGVGLRRPVVHAWEGEEESGAKPERANATAEG